MGLPFGVTPNKGRVKDTEVPKKVLGEVLRWDTVMPKEERKAAAGRGQTVFFQSSATIPPCMRFGPSVWTLPHEM